MYRTKTDCILPIEFGILPMAFGDFPLSLLIEKRQQKVNFTHEHCNKTKPYWKEDWPNKGITRNEAGSFGHGARH